MARNPVGGSRLAEWGVLGASALSVLLLGLGAASPLADPERAAARASQEEFAQARAALRASWHNLRLAGPPAPPCGESFRWRAPLPPPRPARAALATGPLEEAFELDLEQATRAELVERDLERARAWVEEALRLPRVSPERRAQGLLRRLQLALAAEDVPDARDAFDELRRTTDWDVVQDGLPLRLLASLALAPRLDEERRAALQAQAIAAWDADELAFDVDGAVLRRDGLVVEVREDPRLLSLQRALLELAPSEARVLSGAAARRAARALDAHLGLPPQGAVEQHLWSLRATELGWFCHGPDPMGGGARGHFVDPAAVAEELIGLARRSELLATDFQLGAQPPPDADRLAATPVSLEGEGIALTLYHTSPALLGAAQRTRALWTRAALVAAALAVALGSVVTLRGLRRERSLGELRSRFVANVSHDLRTPLASILLMAENLESGRVSDAATAARYHARIRAEGARLRRMVDEVLDFSALEHGERPRVIATDFDLRPFAEELRGSFAGLATRLGGELEFELGDLPPGFVGDPGALRRVFDNLVDNALKHGAAPVEVRLELRGEALFFEVRDHGPGVPPAQRERIFAPFARLAESAPGKAPGVGLGLAMARELVRAHGGTLAVSSPADGRGALFTCQLPLEEPHE